MRYLTLRQESFTIPSWIQHNTWEDICDDLGVDPVDDDWSLNPQGKIEGNYPTKLVLSVAQVRSEHPEHGTRCVWGFQNDDERKAS